jgi:putative ABC transport system permease protein
MKDITLFQLIYAYAFVLVLMVIVKIRKIPREKLILISSIRMTIQLSLAGYLLTYIFKYPSPFITIVIICIMLLFAVNNVIKRSHVDVPNNMKKSITVSMFVGILISSLYFIFIVVAVKPWYNPVYFIPITGMLIGNSMTGVSLGVNTLMSSITTQKDSIETALMLGATPSVASRNIVNKAFDNAILPTVNSMLGTGVVFLPGMMTGQILGGASPLAAIKYQIGITLGILGSVTLTTWLFLYLASKSLFNSNDQLNL